VLDYKSALAKYFPGEAPDYVSFEGYIAARVLTEGLRRVGRDFDVEKLVDAFEDVRGFDLGLGVAMKFSPSDHQASHTVWGTQLDNKGRYNPIDLE
jgi:ABC-type branched-subunit amino acid transport system substrate-binding protein